MKKSKRELLLAAAKALFWKHGFQRVSVEEVCENAAVSKMTFYRIFPNKIELAKAVLDQEMTIGAERFRAILHSADLPEKKVRDIILLKQEGVHDVGSEFLSDFYANRVPDLSQYIEAKTRERWRLIVDDFRAAQSVGVFRSDIKPEIIVLVSQKMTELLNDPAVPAMYDRPEDFIMELTNMMIYGLLPHK